MIAADPVAAMLHAEALQLGAKARACFDAGGDAMTMRARLRPEARAMTATESLRVTTRLLEIIVALIIRQAGGTAPVRVRDDTLVPSQLGGPAREIAIAVRDLYLRTFPR